MPDERGRRERSARIGASMRHRLRRLREFRRAPAASGAVNLIIPGTRRSATTSLQYYLSEHPQISFVGNAALRAAGLGEQGFPYNSPFPVETSRERARDAYRAVLPRERAGVDYHAYRAVYAIYYPHILFNLAEHLPDLRIVMSLRNPVDASYSVYCRQWERGEERSAEDFFAEALAEDRGTSGLIGRGIYYPGVQLLHRLFPPERIHLVSFEDLTQRTAGTLRGICRFLGIDEGYPFERIGTVRGASRKPGPLAPQTRQRLAECFDPYNQKLFALVGWPRDTWQD